VAVQTTTYPGVGVVKRLDPKRPSIEIDHEDIKDLMPAMTMEFYVKDKSLLEGLQPGDRIAFTIENGVGGVKITEIKRR
jgi:Cu/Ag efflux protein CusF